jgi:Tol biopolymer transport system component
VTSGAGARRGQISISQDAAQIAYVERTRRLDLCRLDFDPKSEMIGEPMPLIEGRNAIWPDASPDGEWVVFYEGLGQQQEDIAIIRPDGTGYRKLTNDSFVDRHPHWSPDGRRIAFGIRRKDTHDIWVVNRDGSSLEQLTSGEVNHLYFVWSPDGAFLVYHEGDHPTVLSMTSSTSPTPSLAMLSEENAEFIAWSWSRDGTRLAGWRRIKSTGRDAGILVYSFESKTYESLTDYGRNPVWLSDSRRLLFVETPVGKIFLVDSETKRINELTGQDSPIYGPASISPDDRFIYTSIRTDESDIWMLTLNQEQK